MGCEKPIPLEKVIFKTHCSTTQVIRSPERLLQARGCANVLHAWAMLQFKERPCRAGEEASAFGACLYSYQNLSYMMDCAEPRVWVSLVALNLNKMKPKTYI